VQVAERLRLGQMDERVEDVMKRGTDFLTTIWEPFLRTIFPDTQEVSRFSR
jgi:hypothetical protein